MSDRGFTLLEVLVALVVLGFLMVGLSQGVRFGLTAWGAQARMIDAGGDLDAVDRTLRGLIARIDPGTRADPPMIAGDPTRFTFSSVLPEALGAREADLLVAMNPDHRLLLRWTPHLHAKRTRPPPAPQTEELLRGIAGLEFAYRGSGGWVRSWNAADLPALVRIRVVFPAGDPRHWPDIVAAPLRSRPKR